MPQLPRSTKRAYYKYELLMDGAVVVHVRGAAYRLDRETVIARPKSVEPERLQTHAVLVNGRGYPVKQAFGTSKSVEAGRMIR